MDPGRRTRRQRTQLALSRSLQGRRSSDSANCNVKFVLAEGAVVAEAVALPSGSILAARIMSCRATSLNCRSGPL